MKLNINPDADNAMEFFNIEADRGNELMDIIRECVDKYIKSLDSILESESMEVNKQNILLLIEQSETVEEVVFTTSSYEGLIGVTLLGIDEEE